MIYKEHDFTENFCNAVGYKDESMMRDIMFDELSRLIVEEKPDVIKLLRNDGINANVQDSDIVISNLITKEIAKGNNKITNGIADLIAKNRFEETKYKSFLSADSTDSKLVGILKGIVNDKNVQDTISNLAANQLKKSFDKKAPDTTAKNNANLTERLKMSQASNTTKKVNTKAILIILGIAVVVVFVGIKLYKSSHQTSM